MLLSRDGVIIDLNSQMAVSLGKTIDQLKGQPIRQSLPADGCLLLEEPLRRVVEERRPQIFESCRNGVWHESVLRPVLDNAGEVLGITMTTCDITPGKRMQEQLGLSFDITERVRMEEALRKTEESLRESQSRLHIATKAARLIAFEWDPVTDRVKREGDAQGVLGVKNQNETGQEYFSRMHPEDRAMFHNLLRSLTPAHSSYTVRYRAFRPDGSEIVLEGSGQGFFDSNGVLVRLTGMTTDVTERKRAEDDRLLLSKLESTELLAQGIAHDYNNLLQALTLNIDLVESTVAAGQDAAGLLEDIRTITRTATTLTRQFLTLARGRTPVRKPASLGQLINDAAIAALSGSDIKCLISMPETSVWAEVDEGQIGQVLRNLLINAREAQPTDHAVTVALSCVILDDGNALGLARGHYARIDVADKGCGIAPTVLPQIFDPYFSTKERGPVKGMGLGLTICHSAIQKHGGKIVVESEPKVGTTFSVYLPACPKPDSAPAMHHPARKLALFRKYRVLVMDDEVMVRSALHATLEDKGFDVIAASNGEEAVRIYTKAKADGIPFDAVILDLTIRGGMGGKDAVQCLLKEDPMVKAIVMSGYSEDPVLAAPQKYGFKAGMVKSFDADELNDLLRQVIGQ